MRISAVRDRRNHAITDLSVGSIVGGNRLGASIHVISKLRNPFGGWILRRTRLTYAIRLESKLVLGSWRIASVTHQLPPRRIAWRPSPTKLALLRHDHTSRAPVALSAAQGQLREHNRRRLQEGRHAITYSAPILRSSKTLSPSNSAPLASVTGLHPFFEHFSGIFGLAKAGRHRRQLQRVNADATLCCLRVEAADQIAA